MPMTRQRARSSFTFEIKRANRRAAEVATVNKATSGSLADQVFGKIATGSTGRTIDAAETLGSAPTPVPNIDLFKTTSQPLRRVLPDLLTILVDPVEERAKREAKEKARRRASRTVEVKATRQLKTRPEPVSASGPVAEAARQKHTIQRPTDLVATPPVPSETVEKAAPPDSRKGKS